MPVGRPLIIAHRGASGYRPEHTVAAYELAIRQRADYIEPDVVITRDGVLVVRHENELSTTTDIAGRPEFAHRRATKRIDGKSVTGWFAEDLSLEEIRSLRVRERLAFRSHDWDGEFRVLSLQEVIDLARDWERRWGRPVGLYPETKHPTYFRSVGLPLEEPLIELLEKNGYRSPADPVFLQSFEIRSLKHLRQMTRLRLVQLLGEGQERPYGFADEGEPRTYAELCAPGGLAEIATYADAVGCHRGLVVPEGPDGRLLPPTPLVTDAHGQGLEVHVWTLRNEPWFLPAGYGGDPDREYRQFFSLGVDGVFTDFPDTAVEARRRLVSATCPGL